MSRYARYARALAIGLKFAAAWAHGAGLAPPWLDEPASRPRRGESSRLREIAQPLLPGPAPRKHVMDRRGQPMTEAETAELNEILAGLNATARYRPDGSRYMVDAA